MPCFGGGVFGRGGFLSGRTRPSRRQDFVPSVGQSMYATPSRASDALV